MPTKKASSTEQLKESAAASSKASKSTAAKKPKAAAKPKGTKTTTKRTAAKQQYKLVIVESPAKAKTIQKYLGKGYQVMASMGHVRDLPKSRLGVDIEHDFAPEYIDIRGKGQLRNELKKAAKHASFVYLATDPDREGEAISWHCLLYTSSCVSEPAHRHSGSWKKSLQGWWSGVTSPHSRRIAWTGKRSVPITARSCLSGLKKAPGCAASLPFRRSWVPNNCKRCCRTSESIGSPYRVLLT